MSVRQSAAEAAAPSSLLESDSVAALCRAGPIVPTIVTSRPSRIQVMPNATIISR